MLPFLVLFWKPDPVLALEDPAPPQVAPLPADLPVPAAAAIPETELRRAPRALPADAIVEDWPRLLGPRQAMRCGEAPLVTDWSVADRRQPIWTTTIGAGFSAPVVVDGRVLTYRRIGDRAVLDCLRIEDGARYWRAEHATDYQDRFRYNGGPRATPVVAAGRVVTYSPLGRLRCHDLATGHLFWERDCSATWAIPPAFFGLTTSPLIVDEMVYLNVGGRDGPEMAAFDLASGALRWTAGDAWGAGYATPVATRIGDRDLLVAFLGGIPVEKNPPYPGGLLVLDRLTGEEILRHPWRAEQPFSVNASSPVIADDRVLISSIYGPGALAVELRPEQRGTVAYRTQKFASHWMTPVLDDGILYGFAEQTLVALRWSDGHQLWQQKLQVPTADIAGLAVPEDGEKAQALGRSSLLAVDDRFLCLGENGLSCWLACDADGVEILSAARLFTARQTYVAPVISHGLLFVMQNEADRTAGTGRRMLCYDLRPDP